MADALLVLLYALGGAAAVAGIFLVPRWLVASINVSEATQIGRAIGRAQKDELRDELQTFGDELSSQVADKVVARLRGPR